jgi:hypothetical protein
MHAADPDATLTLCGRPLGDMVQHEGKDFDLVPYSERCWACHAAAGGRHASHPNAS